MQVVSLLVEDKYSVEDSVGGREGNITETPTAQDCRASAFVEAEPEVNEETESSDTQPTYANVVELAGVSRTSGIERPFTATAVVKRARGKIILEGCTNGLTIGCWG